MIQSAKRNSIIFVATMLLPLAATPLRAQDARPDDESARATEEFVPPADFDWSQLATDPSSLLNKTLKPGGKSTASNNDMSWKRDDKPDGSAALTVKQPVVPFWDTRIGADMNVVTQTPMTSGELLAQKMAHNDQPTQSNGTAWAAMTAPGLGMIWDKTSIEARIDPSQDQSKVGTSLQKTLPLAGNEYALTFQNGYSVTQQTLVPVTGLTGKTARNYEVDQSAKFSLNNTGTSFIAGQTFSSATPEEKWLRKLGAEQKIFGGVSVTGTVAETPLGVPDRSLTAKYKYSW